MLQNLPKRRCSLINSCLALNRPWRPYMLCLSLVSQILLGDLGEDPWQSLCHGSLLRPGGLQSRLFRPGRLRSRLLRPGGLLSRLLRPGGLLSRLLSPGGLRSCLLRLGTLLCRLYLGSLSLPHGPGPLSLPPLPSPLHHPPGLFCVWSVWKPLLGGGSVTDPVHGLPLSHHQRSLTHHMDSCTTLTVALHLRLQFPSPIALTIHALNMFVFVFSLLYCSAFFTLPVLAALRSLF